MAIVTQQSIKSYPGQKDIRVKALVSISGKNILFVTLVVDQSYARHHSIEVKVDTTLAQNSFLSDVFEKMDLMGKDININFSTYEQQGDAYKIKGIITDIGFEGLHGYNKYLIIKAKSPTILLENGKKYSVFDNTSPAKMMNEVFRNFKNTSRFDFINADLPSTPVEFAMQYNESDWEFINRLCYQYGQNIYFSGSQLIIGNKPSSEWNTVELTYDKEITELNFSTRIQSLSFTNYTYDFQQDKLYKSSSQGKGSNLSDYLDVIKQKSELLNADVSPELAANVQNLDINTLAELTESDLIRKMGTSVYVTGKSTNYWATIGRPLKINKESGSSLGNFRVIKSRHIIGADSSYSCHFEAVLLGLTVVPVDIPDTSALHATTLLATITNSDDPLGLGRVQVQFQFKGGFSRAWLRVLTADAGTTDAGVKNRGLILVPEKGTQVVISFLMGDSSQPYVSGAFYHGKNADIPKEGNHIKSFTSRSGLTVVFDDSKEKLGITIADTTGEIVQIDAKNKTVNILATEAINLQAKNITINATEKLTLQGAKIEEQSKDHQVQTEGTHIVEANSQTIKTNNLKHTSTGSLEIISGSNVDVKGSKVNIDSGGNAQSPKAPTEARNMTAFVPIPASVLESEILPDDNNVEQQGENPQIISIRMLDDNGQETEYLSRSTNVEVETKDMAGKTVELKLKDKETGNDVLLGDFFIPTNDYVVKTTVRKKEHHAMKS